MSRIAAAAQLCDAVTPIAPRGASRVHLRVGRTAEGAPRIEAVGSATDAPTWARELALDTTEYVALAHGALLELAAPELVEVTIERDGPEPRVTLFAAGGRELAEISVPEAAAARFVFAAPLLESLHRAGPELRARHEALAAELRGHDDWTFDAAREELALVRGALPWRRWPARRLAAFSTDDGVLTWSFADPEVPQSAAEPVANVCRELARTPGHAALDTPWFPCDEALAVRLAAWVALRMGARGMYPGARDGKVLFLSLGDTG